MKTYYLKFQEGDVVNTPKGNGVIVVARSTSPSHKCQYIVNVDGNRLHYREVDILKLEKPC